MRFLNSCLMGLCTVAALASPTLAQMSTMDTYGPPDPAVEAPLDGDALKTLFMDHTHRGYYEENDWDNAPPAFTEQMKADGTAIHERGGVTSVGKWRVKSNVVCFTYDTLNGGCFNMYKRGTCYYAMSAFSSDLVAITVLDDDIPDCEPSYA